MKYLDRDTGQWVDDGWDEAAANKAFPQVNFDTSVSAMQAMDIVSRVTADVFRGTSGPRDAKIMIVGEAWGAEELAQQRPFAGQSGKELERMCAEAGIDFAATFRTNVIADRPPGNEMWRFFYTNAEAKADANIIPLSGLYPRANVAQGIAHLRVQIATVRPKLIIACGNYAMWALTGLTGSSSLATPLGATRIPTGIDSYRGSQVWTTPDFVRTPVLPIFHPAAILRAWYNRAPTVHDLRARVPLALADNWGANPAITLLVAPEFQVAVNRLQGWLARADSGERLRLVCDIETAKSLMTCVGFADSPTFAMSIPWVRNGNLDSYWSPSEELVLFKIIRKLLSHPNVLVEGQNFNYDTQYFRRYMAVVPRLDFDSMLAHHLLFPGTPKGLDYLSSLYCAHHTYWKDDGKEWDGKGGIEQLLRYNATDCVRNFEINTVLRKLIVQMGQTEQWEEVKATALLLQRMMFRGVRIDRSRRAEMALNLGIATEDFAAWFNKIIPQWVFTGDERNPTPWFQSASQQRDTFSLDFGFALPKHKKTGNITFGKEAINDLKNKHPEFVRLFDALLDFRSIRVFHNTFVKAPLDHDDRMRCSYNAAGTETFRFNSSENAFGSGTNLQNIPKGNEDKD